MYFFYYKLRGDLCCVIQLVRIVIPRKTFVMNTSNTLHFPNCDSSHSTLAYVVSLKNLFNLQWSIFTNINKTKKAHLCTC